jgi:hypothetical protein
MQPRDFMSLILIRTYGGLYLSVVEICQVIEYLGGLAADRGLQVDSKHPDASGT